MTGLLPGQDLAASPAALCRRAAAPAISTDAQIVNTVSKVGKATSAVNTECRNLKPEPTCGILEQVMHADRHGDDQEQDEGDPPHRDR